MTPVDAVVDAVVDTVLFDWDGTIVDSHDAILRSYEAVIERDTGRPVRFSDAQGRSIIGRRPHEVLAEYGVRDIEAGVARYNQAYVEAAAEGARAFAGVRAMLSGLAQRGYRLGVVTNKGHERLHADIARLRFDGIFVVEVCAEDTLLRKPNPDPILLGIERAGVEREAVLYVGDNPVDIVAAHAAGVRSAAAGWGPFPREELKRRRPSLMLDSPEELAAALADGIRHGPRQNGAANLDGPGRHPALWSVAVSPEPTEGPYLFAGAIEEGLAAIAAAGWHGIEIAVRDAAEVDVARLKDALARHSLAVVAISTERMAGEDGLSLDRPELEGVVVGRLREAYRLARVMECPIVLGAVLGTAASSAALRASVVRELEAGEAAAAVPILYAPGNRYVGSWSRTVGEALEAVQAMPAGDTGLALSTFDLSLEETSAANALLAAGDDLRLLYVSDSNGLAPGLGGLDVGRILRTLEAMRYRGPYVLRCQPRPDSRSALAFAAKALGAGAGRAAGAVDGQLPPELRERGRM